MVLSSCIAWCEYEDFEYRTCAFGTSASHHDAYSTMDAASDRTGSWHRAPPILELNKTRKTQRWARSLVSAHRGSGSMLVAATLAHQRTPWSAYSDCSRSATARQRLVDGLNQPCTGGRGGDCVFADVEPSIGFPDCSWYGSTWVELGSGQAYKSTIKAEHAAHTHTYR